MLDSLLLRPMTAGEILDLSAMLFRRHTRTMFGIAAITTVSTIVFLLILAVAARVISPGDTTKAPVAILLVSLLFMTLAVWILAATVSTATALALHGDTPSITASFRETVARASNLAIGASLIIVVYGVTCLSGFLVYRSPSLFSIWPLVLFSFFGFTWPAIVIEKLGAARALQRSYELSCAEARVWYVITAGAILAYLPWIGPAAFAVNLSSAPPLIGNDVVWAVIVSGIAAVVTPFFHMVMTIAYFDVRMRREGYDLYLRAQDIDPAGARP